MALLKQKQNLGGVGRSSTCNIQNSSKDFQQQQFYFCIKSTFFAVKYSSNIIQVYVCIRGGGGDIGLKINYTRYQNFKITFIYLLAQSLGTFIKFCLVDYLSLVFKRFNQ